MDFSYSEEQDEIRALAARIFGDLATHERLKEVEATDDRVDRRLWSELASAGLLGLGVPESVGGAGLGFLETCLVVEESGRAAAAVPLLATTVLGAAPVARFGSAELQQRWLPGVVAGDTVLTGALVETGGDPARPSATARRAGDGWRLSGTKSNVPVGTLADAVVVSASGEDGPALFVVDRGADGVSTLRQDTTSGQLEAELVLDDVVVGPDAVLASAASGDAALRWLLDRASTAVCVQVAGACQAALKLTASYTSQREQFGKPVATFQAVGQRAADAYIDTEAVRLTAWQAAWRLDRGLAAAEEVAIAKFWADDGAQRVVHACQHLHGGVGVDRDYPLHRYYLMVKQLSLTLGGSTTSLLRLGDLLAAAVD